MDKDKVFLKALKFLGKEEFSCLSLKHAVYLAEKMFYCGGGVTPKEVKKYRAIFGFDEGVYMLDPFISAITAHTKTRIGQYNFRVLLLSLAKAAWDDFVWDDFKDEFVEGV